MKLTLIIGIPLSVFVRLGAPLHPLFGDALRTSESQQQDAVSPFGCTKRENEKHITNSGKEMTTFHSHIPDSNINLDLHHVTNSDELS